MYGLYTKSIDLKGYNAVVGKVTDFVYAWLIITHEILGLVQDICHIFNFSENLDCDFGNNAFNLKDIWLRQIGNQLLDLHGRLNYWCRLPISL